MNPYYRPNETAESRLKNTKFLVEATSMEDLMLWSRHAKESSEKIDKNPVEWQQISPGYSVTVGELDKRPIVLSMQWIELNGILICFYYACSQVVDYVQVESWLDKHYNATWDGGTRQARCDAMNFHHCLHAIKELKDAQKL